MNTDNGVLYEVVRNDERGRFEPISGVMMSTKREAIAELRKQRGDYPDAYIAKVAYSRC
jgi:hypothetical protein